MRRILDTPPSLLQSLDDSYALARGLGIVHVKEHKEAMFIKTLYTKATKVVANVESLGIR